MIRIAARQADGTKLKMDAHVNSLEDAWDLLHSELKAKKIPTSGLVAIQLTQSKQTRGGLQVLGQPSPREERRAAKGGVKITRTKAPRAKLVRGVSIFT